MNQEQKRLRDKKKVKDSIIEGHKESIIDATEMLSDRKLFWYEER